MTLLRLLEILRGVPGCEHPARFRTPDGKFWEPERVVSVRIVRDGSAAISYETVTHLKEVEVLKDE